MLEQGTKKRNVACAFDWPGWDRSARLTHDVLPVLEAYRPRYAQVAALAGYGAEFDALGALEVVEQLPGTAMTDYYGVSARAAAPEHEPMTDAECDRKLALLRAAWRTFDETAARVTGELRKGPRGGGRERDRIVQHVNAAEMGEFARKVGVTVPEDRIEATVADPAALAAYREEFVAAVRDHHERGAQARSWQLPFLVRRCTWHMLDHAWEIEDRAP